MFIKKFNPILKSGSRIILLPEDDSEIRTIEVKTVSEYSEDNLVLEIRCNLFASITECDKKFLLLSGDSSEIHNLIICTEMYVNPMLKLGTPVIFEGKWYLIHDTFPEMIRLIDYDHKEVEITELCQITIVGSDHLEKIDVFLRLTNDF